MDIVSDDKCPSCGGRVATVTPILKRNARLPNRDTIGAFAYGEAVTSEVKCKGCGFRAPNLTESRVVLVPKA